MKGKLFIVPTPIGNLGDMTYRGVETLKEATLIAAEDTRRTSILLNNYQIRAPLISYHEHNEKFRSQELVQKLLNGEKIALVSDAGMPGISDPGFRLISLAIDNQIPITVLPGASAFLPALIGSGLPFHEFVFLGFLPKKQKALEDKLSLFKTLPFTILFYESPKRLHKTLSQCQKILGDRRAVICRELSKIYEEFRRGTLTELLNNLPQNVKGEITVVISA